MSKNELTKNQIRERLIEKRNQLNSDFQTNKSANIVKQVKNSHVFKNAQKIAFYHAVHGEADPKALAKNTSGSKKQFYLPVLSEDPTKGLVFVAIDSKTEYKNNKFSIPEPLYIDNDLIDASALDLVIMPLVGFDKRGNRLGMGGGFYDRCFSFKKGKTINPKLLGFAYDFQEVDSLSAEPWDIPLDMIATDSELLCINK